MEETVSLAISPSSSLTLAPTVTLEVAPVHRYTVGHKKTPSSPIQLPVRLSHARLNASNSSSSSSRLLGRALNRTEVRSKPNRSDPNDYVDDPAPPNRAGKTVRPVSSSESKSISRTESGESKSSDIEVSKEKPHRTVDAEEEEEEEEAEGRSCRESIICPRCKLCRCTKCSEPRPLPPIRCCCCRSRGQCLPEELVVCLSCLWCPRSAYYACADGSEPDDSSSSSSSSSYDRFCSCSGPWRPCCRRWTLLATLVPCLPCLCLYWPLRWTLVACSVCRDYRRRGCRCSGHSLGGVTLESSLVAAEEPENSNYVTNTSRD